MSVQEYYSGRSDNLDPSFNTSYVSVQELVELQTDKEYKGFNTSYVSVQESTQESLSTISFVSIHPMCRFKDKEYRLVLSPSKFQYILCVGSSQC